VTDMVTLPLTPSEDKIRVLVAESNRMASQMMETVLQRHRRKFEVQTITSGSSEVIEYLKTSDTQVAVISAELQDGPLAGFRVLEQLRAFNSNTAPIILLNSVDRDLLIDAFRFRVRGIFTRSHSISTLPKCICAVHNGQLWINNEQIELLLALISRLRPLQVVKPGGIGLLTDRERETVQLVVEGMRNDEIAQNLNISEHTVRNYLSRIFDKLGISSRVELVLYALSR
jgi:two-component system, NarL family, nitrate/nitrite response regulator NarL